jgi:integrase
MAKKAGQRGKGTGTLVMRGKVWCARWTVNGKVFTRTTKTSDRREAEGKLAEYTAFFRLGGEERTLETVAARLGGVKGEIQRYEDEKPATTIRHGWQAYLDQSNRPDSGPSTLGNYESWFEAFARWMEAGHPEVTELRRVTQEHADAYAGHLLKKVSATTFNRHIFLLALVWRILEKTARLSCNPWKGIERKRISVHSRRELTITELQQVCEAARGEMRLLLALGIYCGLRLGDAACLQWSNVDMVKGIISLIPQKTARRSQKRIIIPIHRTLYGLFTEIPAKRRTGYVMPKVEKRYRSFNGALAGDVARVFQSCGIETNVVVAGSKRNRADCGFHSLRHTFVSLCAAGGVSQSVVQALVGHGSPAMTAHYTHIGIETAQNAVALLPDVTHAKALPEHAGATGATLEGIDAMLEGLTVQQLKDVVKQAQQLIGILEKVEVTK